MNDLATKLDQEPEQHLTKTRIKLSVIFLMSLAPFVLAYIVFFVKPEHKDDGHRDLLNF